MTKYWFTYSEQCIAARLPSRPGPLLPFLRAYFEPYIRLSPGSERPAHSPMARLHVEVGPPPADAPDEGRGVDIDIDLSKAFLRCVGRCVDQGAIRWVWMQPFHTLARIDRDAREVAMWGPSQALLRVPVLRVVEDLLTDRIQAGGGILIHASGVIADGRSVIAVGNKGAGKTSALCRWLHSFHVAKLANDNVCLELRDGLLLAHGWPAFFKVHVATVASVPELAGDFPAEHRDILDDHAALWDVYEKVALYPSQGAARFGADVDVQAPLAAIIMLRFGMDRAPGMERVDIDEVAGEMPVYLQGIQNPNHPPWLGIDPVRPETVRASLERVIDAVRVQDIPVYRLYWAPSLDDLLARVPELRATRKSLVACATAPRVADTYPPLPGEESDG